MIDRDNASRRLGGKQLSSAESFEQEVQLILKDVGISGAQLIDGVVNGPEKHWWDCSDRRCRGIPPEIFIPEHGNAKTLAVAREYCVGCPVRSSCLCQSLIDHDIVGVFGGLPERRRRVLRKWLHVHGVRYGKRNSLPSSRVDEDENIATEDNLS
jgi:hypothetical protein